ncbi:SGNH/GDSL hydrolase family protein [Candidatus Uabimicrobium sp. HlEnr_7]|uniref:SGNH/GDSL hydrolase family protein n=1 Tax=Candidatus Uabimicrobium helgolandensis TaxID=3095367 RepID=UPI0035590BE6
MRQPLSIFNFKNPKCWCVLFFLVIFIGDRVIAQVLKTIVNQSQFRYSKLYGQTAQSDFLLIGNSRGLVFHQPTIAKLTKKTTINLSYNSMPVDLACAIMKDYFDLYPAPRCIFFEITMLNYNNKKLISNFMMYRSSANIKKLVERNFPKLNWWCNFSHIYQYNGEVLLRTLYYMFKSDQDWALRQQANISQVKKNINNMERFRYQAKQEDLENLRDLVKLVKSKGSDIKLIIQPLFPGFVQKIKNFNDWKQRISKFTGLKIYDYSQIDFPDHYFVDRVHLNVSGAKAYAKLLYQDGIFK